MGFDYQWRNLPSMELECTSERIAELLDYTGLDRRFFDGKHCLDAGCGTGRWTWAMMQMGAKVDSFDISKEAIAKCREINPHAYVSDITNLQPAEGYDFVLCWGVLHHLPNPVAGFQKVASQVRVGGLLHIMVYHKDTQKPYDHLREIWSTLRSEEEKLDFCRKCATEQGGTTVHGWWDALSPAYNWSFYPGEVRQWFEESGFEHVTLRRINLRLRRKYRLAYVPFLTSYNINMIGQKSRPHGRN